MSRKTRWLTGLAVAFAACIAVPTALAGGIHPPKPPTVKVTQNGTQGATVDQSNANATSGPATSAGGIATGGKASGYGGDVKNSVKNTSGNAKSSADTCNKGGDCTASGGTSSNSQTNAGGAASNSPSAIIFIMIQQECQPEAPSPPSMVWRAASSSRCIG